MADKTQPSPAADAAAQQDRTGPTENEMPDAEAIEKRIQSGADRSDAAAAFGGQADDAKAK